MDSWKDIIDWLSYAFAVIGFLATAYQSIRAWLNFKRFSWTDLDKYTKKIIKVVSDDKFVPDVIVTIGRGGAIVGSILSGNLPHYGRKKCNITILGVDRLYEWVNGQRIEIDNKMIDFSPLKGKKVLLVAGDVMTGGTMTFFLNQLKQNQVLEIRTACLVKGLSSAFHPNYVGKEIAAGFSMPWMYKGFGYSRDSREPNNSGVEKYQR